MSEIIYQVVFDFINWCWYDSSLQRMEESTKQYLISELRTMLDNMKDYEIFIFYIYNYIVLKF